MTQEPAHRVAYLGPEGSFTHAAALAHFSTGKAQLLSAPSIPEVFEAVAEGRSEWGVVPIENSTEGSVTFTLDQLLDTTLSVCGEVALTIQQCLIGRNADLDQIEEVLSHPQALAQCRQWLRTHLPHARLLSWASTSAAVQEIKNRPDAAAIGSALSAEREAVPIMQAGIQDRQDNATRFFVLGHVPTPATGHDKTSLAFATRHERGALRRALEVFDQAGINLTRIESRPRPDKQWQYVFFTDAEGHRDEPHLSRALTELAASSEWIRVFGSYPRQT